jgi:hypothetical protein
MKDTKLVVDNKLLQRYEERQGQQQSKLAKTSTDILTSKVLRMFMSELALLDVFGLGSPETFFFLLRFHDPQFVKVKVKAGAYCVAPKRNEQAKIYTL